MCVWISQAIPTWGMDLLLNRKENACKRDFGARWDRIYWVSQLEIHVNKNAHWKFQKLIVNSGESHKITFLYVLSMHEGLDVHVAFSTAIFIEQFCIILNRFEYVFFFYTFEHIVFFFLTGSSLFFALGPPSRSPHLPPSKVLRVFGSEQKKASASDWSGAPSSRNHSTYITEKEEYLWRLQAFLLTENILSRSPSSKVRLKIPGATKNI